MKTNIKTTESTTLPTDASSVVEKESVFREYLIQVRSDEPKLLICGRNSQDQTGSDTEMS